MATKKLSEFPSVLRAFRMILADQPYPPWMAVRIVPSADIPTAWLKRFALAEQTLKLVTGKTLRSLNIPTKEIESELMHGDVSLSDKAFEYVVLPVNDVNRAIMVAAGAPKVARDATDKVLGEFFDGKLRDIFQTGHLNNSQQGDSK